MLSPSGVRKLRKFTRDCPIDLAAERHHETGDAVEPLLDRARFACPGLASIGAEALWVSSMPSRLPDDEAQIPLDHRLARTERPEHRQGARLRPR